MKMTRKVYHKQACREFTRDEPSKQFIPHTFEPLVEHSIKIPEIVLSRRAYDSMWHIVDLSPQEISWIGTVRSEGIEIYRIDEIFILRQVVSITTTRVTPDSLAEFGTLILNSRPDGLDIVNALRFWGHSHVHMGTSPSSQDDEQMEIFSESGLEYFIRGIFNKRGRAEFTLYRYDIGLLVRDVPWRVEESVNRELREAVARELDEKVTSVPALGSHRMPNQYQYVHAVPSRPEQRMIQRTPTIIQINSDEQLP